MLKIVQGLNATFNNVLENFNLGDRLYVSLKSFSASLPKKSIFN